MGQGLNWENVVKIGFLNDYTDEKLEVFSREFDLVLDEESGFEEVLKIIGNI